jgi:hypothetical protein
LLYEVNIHTRLVIKTLKIRLCDQRDKIFVSCIVPRKEYQMKGGLIIFRSASVQTAARRNIYLAAYNRLEACLGYLFIKLDRTEQTPVVSHGDCRHFKMLCPFHQFFYSDRTVQETVFRMQMEGHIIRV